MSPAQLLALIGRRLVALVMLLIVVSFAIFTLLYLAPGSPEQVLLGTRPASPELRAAIRADFNLDRPFLEQYALWAGGAAQLDFGESIRNGRAVLSAIGDRAGVTVFLGLYAFVVALALGVPLGIVAALRKRSLVDRGAVAFSVLFVSAPSFVTGVLLLYLFTVAFEWFPSYGAGEGFLDRLWHLTLPALALALTAMALLVKLTRSAMVTTLDQDYVAFARARGVSRLRVIVRYGLRNALVPIATASGLVLTVLLTGTVLVETTFSLPGLGTLLVEAVEYKDLPMLQGVSMLLAVVIVLVNLLVDILYAAIDPRIGFGRRPS